MIPNPVHYLFKPLEYEQYHNLQNKETITFSIDYLGSHFLRTLLCGCGAPDSLNLVTPKLNIAYHYVFNSFDTLY